MTRFSFLIQSLNAQSIERSMLHAQRYKSTIKFRDLSHGGILPFDDSELRNLFANSEVNRNNNSG